MVLRVLFALVLSLAGIAPVQAALAPHLDVIELDRMLNDPRFSGLSGAGQSIAVLDTGLDPNHIMIDGSISPFRVPAGANTITPLAPLAPPDYIDGNGHGTAVTSVAAGFAVQATVNQAITLDNRTFNAGDTLETRGVAPFASLVPVRVLGNDGMGTLNSVLNGLNWVIANHQALNIRVVNMSLGTDDTFSTPGAVTDNNSAAQAIEDAVAQLTGLGIPVIASSGNAGATDGLGFPAILHDAIAVGASEFLNSATTTEVAASFSNRDANLDLFAPGVEVRGAVAGLNAGDPDNVLGAFSGTSFSAPQVAGAVLLLNELFESRNGRRLTVSEIRSLLRISDTHITLSDGTEVPRLNLFAALEAAYAIPEPSVALLLVLALLLAAPPRRVAAQRIAPSAHRN